MIFTSALRNARPMRAEPAFFSDFFGKLIELKAMAAVGRPKLDVYPLANFIVVPMESDESAQQESRDPSPLARLVRLKRRFEAEGRTVQSVDGVVVVHCHNHPHVMLLRRTAKSSTVSVLPSTSAVPPLHISYRLPGGKLRGSETTVECLYRKLARDMLGHRVEKESVDSGTAMAVRQSPLGPSVDEASMFVTDQHHAGSSGTAAAQSRYADAVALAQQRGLRVGEVVSVWCRPNFDRPMYPYVPAHVTEPKEVRTLHVVHMPLESVLTVAESDTELIAVPLFDLHENAAKYGALIASLPHTLARFVINLC